MILASNFEYEEFDTRFVNKYPRQADSNLIHSMGTILVDVMVSIDW